MKSHHPSESPALAPASVQKVSKFAPSAGRIAPTTIEHWKTRVFLVPGGNCFAVKIQFSGERQTFNTRHSDRDAAARRARDIYLSLVRQGWAETLRKFKPKPVKVEAAPKELTVGAFLDGVEQTGLVTPAGLISYRTKFRTLIGLVSHVGSGRRRGIEFRAWRAAIDAQPLAVLTQEAVLAHRARVEKLHPTDPRARARARHTFDSMLRHGRSLFRDEIRARLQAMGLLMPPSPFAQVDFFTRGQSAFRYVSEFSVEEVIHAANTELKTSRPVLFLVFVLAVVLGLRRNEIDKLKWTSVAWAERELRIVAHDFFSPKRDSSARRLALDEGILAILQEAYRQRSGEWVIPSVVRPKLNATYRHYRLVAAFKELCTWLRQKGVRTNSPIHTLRKEAGSRMNDLFGIIAAQHFLGHASPEVTWKYYVSERAPKPTGLGALLLAASQAAEQK